MFKSGLISIHALYENLWKIQGMRTTACLFSMQCILGIFRTFEECLACTIY